jgi:hypothetical protein
MHLTLLADMGMPMILVEWPLMIVALVPIIVIETVLIRRWMPLPRGKAFLGVGLANLLSTLVGVPVSWLSVLLLDGLLGAALRSAALHYHWQLRGMPLEHVLFFFLNVAWGAGLGQYPYWFVPAAAAVLLVPCFYASVWLERWVCAKTWKQIERSQVRRSVFRANLASYALLFIGACSWLVYELYAHPL